jgi:glycosyltransferase involved in cell wall biosynthesis
VERALARRTTHFIAVSPSEATLARHLHLAPSNALSIVPNGVELSTPFEGLGKQLRENLGIPPDAFVVGTLSRPVHQKAPEVFMRAALSVARQDPSAQVIMIGSSPLGRTVFHEAAELGRRFHLVDQLDDAAEYLDAFDVYASASRFEGGPYAPLEAMRAGVPVVLTDVVGNRDIVEHEQTGLLVPPDNPRALADALEELRHDKDLRETLAKAATAALSQFDVRVSGERTGAIYSALTGARR